jgi:hypothetical protein
MARRDEDPRYTPGQDRDDGGSAFGTALRIGGIIGAGAVGWRYRREIGSGLRNATEFTGTFAMAGVEAIARSAKFKETVEDVSAFARALNYAADGRSEFRHMANPSRFQDRFNESLAYSLEDMARSRNAVGSDTLQAVDEFQHMRDSLKMSNQKVFEAHRFEMISQELHRVMPDHMKNGLASQLSLRDDSWFYNMTKGKVEGFTDHLISDEGKKQLGHKIAFKNESEKEDFQNKMFETLKKFEDKKADGYAKNAQNKTDLRTAQKKIRDGIYNGYVERNKARQDFVSRMMGQQGYRRATFEDLRMHKDGNLLQEALDRHIKAVRDGRRVTNDGHVSARYDSKIGKLMEVDPRVRDLVADKDLWINGRGELLNTSWMTKARMNFVDGFRRNTQVPWLRFNPLDLLHFTTYEGARDAPKTLFKAVGTIDPALHGAVKELQHPLAHNQDAAVGVLGRGYVNTADGKLYDLTTGDLVKEDVYQMSGRFGLAPRMMAGMANLHTADYSKMNALEKLFDFKWGGKHQETQTIAQRMMSTVTKFDNYDWGPNILDGMEIWKQDASAGISEELRRGLSPESGYKLMYSQLESKSTALSYDTRKLINQHVKDSYGDIDIDLMRLNTDEEVMTALGRLNNAIMTPNSGVARVSTSTGKELEGIDKLINQTWTKYATNKKQFMDNQRILPNNAPYLPEWASALDWSDTELVPKIDDVRKLIHMHASRQLRWANQGTDITVGKLVQDGIRSGDLEKGALSEVRNLETLSSMRNYWEDVYKNPLYKDQALSNFSDRVLDTSDPLSLAAQDSMKDMNKWWAMGPGQEPPQYFGFVGHISMNKAKGHRWALENYNEKIARGVSPTAAAMDSMSGVIGQFFAGRRNLSNVTTATMPGYILTERMDNAVAQVGLGLSQKNRGSALGILANQFGRRIVLPYMAYQQAMWLDGLFGDAFSDKAADAYVNMHSDVAYVKEWTGLNDFGRQWSRVFQGGDQLTETPFFKAFDFATFGLFGNTRSGEDDQEYYKSGEDPIRKGRYWGIGSNTPFTGGNIDRYVPNWYRRLKSDYKFTDTMYGSENEYWANNWVPTLTHPLAPLRHFLIDPYHWEKKHEEDRPYPVTGGFSELQRIPLIGSGLDNTVGRMLKPRLMHPGLEKAHRQYLEELNASIEAQYDAVGQGGMLQGMPAGGYNIIEGEPTEGSGIGGTGGGGTMVNGISGITPEQYQMLAIEGQGKGGRGGVGGITRGDLAVINSMYSDVGGPSLGRTGKNIGSLNSLEDLRDPDVVANLKDIGNMYSFGSSLRDSVYSAGELGGMYGFLTKSMIGFNESGRGMTLDSSDRMTSYQRAFWDMELGGLGGAISEIGRRYNPRDPNKNYWNPIRNTMPEWMPGVDYFIDFQHGDPYTKVANGEMRLPGKAYEKLYKLHPDALGQYGAFDRYRILADVAPYSENFKFYKGMVSKMNQAGMLSDQEVKEFGEIRDQVAARKSKYRFYNRRFRDADVNYETVHITRMLDATTFLTKEHPDNPIRMAGVKVKADDEETTNWLQQYVHEGAEVRIAVDADPLYRVRDDTYNTMHAVVYANHSEEGLDITHSTKGQNINFMLANRKTGGFMGLGGKYNVSTHDDGSATSTQALFSNDMVTVGKLWEWTTHDLLPTLPVVGTIADKFLQVRSPLEMYKRQEVYGKAWRPWNHPISGWIQPMIESIQSHNPVIAAAQGAGIGWLFTRGAGKYWGTRVGAVVGGAFATARVFKEQFNKMNPNADDDTWIPERRRKEREINEYFDKLRYVKYRGLYERAAREAKLHEHVDIDSLINDQQDRGGKNKARRNVLESMKKWLSMNKKLGYGDKEAVDSQLDQVRADLKEIEADRPNQRLGKYSMLALRYRAEYESTLYGADENGDMTKIFRALPSKDREFFTEFMKASPKDREEILKLVPKDQRRFYQAKWGLKVDEKESLQHYFSTHTLPGAGWDGWKPDKSLENYKIKVIKNEGLELTEFGDWGDDEKRAEESNATVLPMTSVSGMIDVTRLERVLHGAGLSDVSVTMETSTAKGDNKINLAMNLIKDRSNEIVNEINNNLGSIMGS